MPNKENKQYNDNFKVITFNLKYDKPKDQVNGWKQRKELVLDFIRTVNPSVMGIQELLPSMKQDVSEKLQEYSLFGYGRKKDLKGEHSDILINNAQADLIDAKTFWLSKTPFKPGSKSLYTPFPRICTMAEVYLKNFNQKVRIFNTHLDHIYPFMRMRGIKTILEFMNDYDQKEKLPIILMGDFNALPTSLPIMYLKQNLHQYKNIKLRDAYSLGDNDNGIRNTFHGFKGKTNKRLLDYIFISEELDVKNIMVDKSQVNGRFLSDHYPVIADLSFK